MKRVLITGKNSYIGTSFKRWLEQHPDKYEVDSISVRDNSWKEKDFSSYDVVYHVAAVVHKKETEQNKGLYYEINKNLSYKVAEKSKREGIKQFIFLSTMSVYGLENGIVDKDTELTPKSNYGKSKLQAEELIKTLEDNFFNVSILRPPIVYGKNCKGNYSRLSILAKITPIFPDVENKRSMIYIDNLNEFVRLLIDNNSNGIFYPQNKEYVNTSEMVKMISKGIGRRVMLIKMFNPFLRLMKISVINKVFGDLVYEMCMSEYSINYRVYDLEESILKTLEVTNDK